MTVSYERGAVVRGPDVFAPHEGRPDVRLSDETHPFNAEEGLYAAVTTTPRPSAIVLADSAFETGTLPRESYVNPWTIATIKRADMARLEGRLASEVTDTIARATAGYMGLDPS